MKAANESRGPSILVVDDDQALASTLKDFLTREGYVAGAPALKVALRAFRDEILPRLRALGLHDEEVGAVLQALDIGEDGGVGVEVVRLPQECAGQASAVRFVQRGRGLRPCHREWVRWIPAPKGGRVWRCSRLRIVTKERSCARQRRDGVALGVHAAFSLSHLESLWMRETDRRCTESFCRRFDLSLRPGRVLYGHGTLKDKDRKEDSLHLQDKAGNDQTDDKEICASGSEAAQAHRAWANDLFEDRLSGKCLPRDT